MDSLTAYHSLDVDDSSFSGSTTSSSNTSGSTTEDIVRAGAFHGTDVQVVNAPGEPHSKSCWPVVDHYDPIHFTPLVNNTVSDTLSYVAIVSVASNISLENCVAAGVIGNVASALATSPYVSSKLMALLPNEASRDVAKNLDRIVRTIIDPGYFAYYASAWPALGAATIPEAAAFILVSAMMRKGASLLMQSNQCKGTLEQQAAALDPTTRTLQSSLVALLRVGENHGLDVFSSLSRNLVVNIKDMYQKGTKANEALDKILYGAAVYVVASFVYYACYRAFEQLGSGCAGMYKKTAGVDAQNAEQLKAHLESNGLASHEAQEVPSADNLANQEEGLALVATENSLPPVVLRARLEELSKAFEFLRSPLVNLFKDPVFRSCFECHSTDPQSQEAVEAFHAVDHLEQLKKVVSALESDTNNEQALAAYKILLQHLGITIPSGEISPEEVGEIQNKGIDALISMFKRYSAPIGSPRASLLDEARVHGNYGAINEGKV